MRNKWWVQLLRGIAIFFMGLTAFFTMAGGAGTTCVALAAEKYGETMAPIVPYKWLYIIFVLVTVAIGVMGARATVLLAKGRKNAYRYSLIALIAGVVVGVIHILVSRSLRGSSMPVDAVVYTTVLTLVIFLLIRIPGIWAGANFDKSAGDKGNVIAAAFTLLACGLLTLTVNVWAGPTHTWAGTNWADAWHIAMLVIGLSLITAGIVTALNAEFVPVRKIVAETQ